MDEIKEVKSVDFSKMYSKHIDGLTECFRNFLKKGIFIEGETLSTFEKQMEEYLGVKHVIGTSNGTTSIELCLRAENIGQEDEVITVSNTYYATLQPIFSVGAVPVFCDVDQNCVIDVSKIEKLITNKTKAIIPVHLYGIPVKIKEIREIAAKYNLVVIEDCAHAFGSMIGDKYIGDTQDYCSFSFYPTKNMGAFGDAGMVVTNDDSKAEKIRSLRYFTANKERSIFLKNAMHARLDSIQACFLGYMLPRIKPYLERRKEIAKLYIKAFEGKIHYIKGQDNSSVVPYVFPILVDDQDKFMHFIMEKGIWVQIHYKPELHKIDYLKGIVKTPMENTEFFNNHLVSLPIFPTLTDEEIQYVIKQVYQYFEV